MVLEEYVNYFVYVLCVLILLYFLKDHIKCFFNFHKYKTEGYIVEESIMGDLCIIETKCTKCKCYKERELYREYKLN